VLARFAGALVLATFLCVPLEIRAQTVSLIPTNAPWKYLDAGVDPGVAWRAPAFDASYWPTGLGPLGYGEPFVNTMLNLGSGTNRLLTAYFRRTFIVPNAAAITGLTMRLLRDDGAVVYLNGTELFRTTCPSARELLDAGHERGGRDR